MTRLRVTLGLLAVPVLALALVACGDDDTTSSSEPADAAVCDLEAVPVRTAGEITIGTDSPAFPPYFEDDNPTNGKGFESAVAYAIADKLGFTNEQVKWEVVPFNSSFAPGPKKFDFDINQISITPERQEQVDFSVPYYSSPQAVLVAGDGKYAEAASIADIKDATFGVQIGTTSLDSLTDVVEPSKEPQVFNDSNDVVQAFKSGRIDAIVVDLPTAFFLNAVEIPESKIAGQFEAPGGDTWGVVLSRQSELTACVNQALNELTDSGELETITETWMGDDAGAPTLQ